MHTAAECGYAEVVEEILKVRADLLEGVDNRGFFVILLFCYFVILLFCYFVILLFCYFVILLFYILLFYYLLLFVLNVF